MAVQFQPVKQLLFWLIMVGAMLIALLLSRSPSSRLYFAPDAQREIDRAKLR